jgi:hypothetical protein
MMTSALAPARIPAAGASVRGAADWDREAPDPLTLGALAAEGAVADLIIAAIAVLSSSVLGCRIKGGLSIGTMLMVRMDRRTLSLGIICEDTQPDVKTQSRSARLQRFISTFTR